MKALMLSILMILGCVQVWASHIIGGHIVVTPKNTGQNIRLSLLYDELSPGNINVNVTVSIFRKKDNVRETDITLNNLQKQEKPFTNTDCVANLSLKMVEISYNADVNLSLTDAAGYYVVWEQCCRSSALSNIHGVGAGFVFYTEIPPTIVRNSSPEFITPTLEILCQNKPQTVALGATDADRDELRYSLATPLGGFSDAGNANPKARPGPYPKVRWITGYDSTKIVAGTVQLDTKTGILNVTSLQTGQYVLSVLCEEYRAGTKIGESRRDWILIVVDCPPIVNWKLNSSNKNTVCQGDSTILEVKPTGNFNYRWQRDNQVLPTTTNQLTVKEAGLYRVLVADKTSQCTRRDSVVIKIAAAPDARLTASGPTVFCANDSIKLATVNSNSYQYLWFENNAPSVSAVTAEFKPTRTGLYSVVVTDITTDCATKSNALAITVKESPKVTLDAISPLCGTGTQAVTLKGLPFGGTYEGNGVLNGRFISLNLSPGKYPVSYSFTNAQGCKGTANREIMILAPPQIKLPNSTLTIARGDSVEIKTTVPVGAGVSWSPTNGLNNLNATRVMASPDRTTTYKIKVTTGEGCVVEGEVRVLVIDLTIPNGFSPNNDGINDTWEIAGIKDFAGCVVEIYNRWGNVLYRSLGYEKPWDGTYNNETVALDTYYYRLYFRESDYTIKGSLVVLK
jgi:gliding motility-associated-like protein